MGLGVRALGARLDGGGHIAEGLLDLAPIFRLRYGVARLVGVGCVGPEHVGVVSFNAFALKGGACQGGAGERLDPGGREVVHELLQGVSGDTSCLGRTAHLV